MKLRFTVLGFEIAAWELQDLHSKADAAEAVVHEVEKHGMKLTGRVVDRFSTAWMKAWVAK
ncbi:DUF7429 family protein [Mycobacterium paragordonae]|uniref:Uncharacterized protein n=1 Tax=Mycobacterium paragordonae TaxID=1389713 RepID=A0AAJ1RZF0_9MYCO|nr:hypothetical protein [Mycobacterium paragordonae]MDP7733672.1 hypothetical protein [Mycobacterium paragordonae]